MRDKVSISSNVINLFADKRSRREKHENGPCALGIVETGSVGAKYEN
jgi:hypothetical protein